MFDLRFRATPCQGPRVRRGLALAKVGFANVAFSYKGHNMYLAILMGTCWALHVGG